MEMEDQYGLADLRQLMSGGTRSHFPPSIPQHHDLFSPGYRNLSHPPPHHHHHNPYDLMMMMPRELPDFRSDSAATGTAVADASAVAAATAATVSESGCGFEVETGCLGGGEGGTGRWPRQETLTLLEIRSRLDSKFKEANQKGPLWDEVSRIMAEEHSYQRSGKKCREKFENLYKYYKKTKEGKAGRQDGKNYRFFRQLEALYGESSNATDRHFAGDSSLRFGHPSSAPLVSQETQQSQKHYSDSLSLSNTSEFETSSSDDNDNDNDDDLGSVGAMDNDSAEKRRKKRSGGKSSWKAKIKQFIDSQMKKLIDKQEVWLEKLMKTLEQKEKDRMFREEEWRMQEVSRIDRERSFWAKERTWIEARDAALMEALQKLTGRELREYNSSPDHGLMAAENQNHGENQNEDGSEILNNSTVKGDHYHSHHDHDTWPESEIAKLIQLRTAMKSKFRQSGPSFTDQEILWEEIASKMACLGYDRNPLMCKEKWESIENYQRKIDQGNKKRKENYSRSGSSYNIYFQTDSSLYSTTQGGAYCEMKEQSPNSSNAAPGGGTGTGTANAVPDSCFRFLMGEGDQSQSGLWENYGLKLNNGGDQT